MLFFVLSLLAFSFKFWIPSLLEIAKRLSAIFLLTFKFAAYASFPWKLNRYSYGVQFGINCTALDQSKLSKIVECTIKREIVILKLLYFIGFAKPLAMFPLNADCQHLEYFSQKEMAIVSDIYPGPGPEGHPQGSLQLKDISDSFIVIPNLSGGLVDAEKSITLLAFIYPLRESRMMISYHPDGLGVQLACEFDDEIGKLTASFIQRDLMPAEMPITAKVLEYNEWNFVGASYDFETGMAILWHNGSVVKSANIGKGLSLATQFDIKISVTDSSSSENKFSVRVSHLHIYGEALTSENIQAIGAISHKGKQNTTYF